MTIFANCHIFSKIFIFVKYDIKKTYGLVANLPVNVTYIMTCFENFNAQTSRWM